MKIGVNYRGGKSSAASEGVALLSLSAYAVPRAEPRAGASPVAQASAALARLAPGFGAGGALARAGLSRYAPAGTYVAPVRLAPETDVLADAATLQASPAAAPTASPAQGAAALRALARTRPDARARWMLVPSFETAA